MRELANVLNTVTLQKQAAEPPQMHWLATIPRNCAFAATVISLGLRRLLPPY